MAAKDPEVTAAWGRDDTAPQPAARHRRAPRWLTWLRGLFAASRPLTDYPADTATWILTRAWGRGYHIGGGPDGQWTAVCPDGRQVTAATPEGLHQALLAAQDEPRQAPAPDAGDSAGATWWGLTEIDLKPAMARPYATRGRRWEGFR